MTDEYWLPIPGWEGWYSVSSLGRVRSEHRKIVRSDNVEIIIREKPRKVITWPNGRKTVRLRRDGQQFTVRIDWLMAELFGTETPAKNGHRPANNGDSLTNADVDLAAQQTTPDGHRGQLLPCQASL